jgi:hypothetical protein
MRKPVIDSVFLIVVSVQSSSKIAICGLADDVRVTCRMEWAGDPNLAQGEI